MDEIDLIQDHGYGDEKPYPMNPEPSYPTLHYSGKKDLDLPQSGTMDVKFRVKREVKSVDKSGEEHYECDIEISSIEDVESDDESQPYSRDKSGEEALDELMKEKEGE